MVAVVEFDVQHGSAPGTTQTDAPNAHLVGGTQGASSNAARDANPVVVVTATTVFSFDRWYLLRFASGTATQMDTFRVFYTSFVNPTPAGSVTFFVSAQNPSINPTYATPTETNSSLAATNVETTLTTDPADEQINGTLNSVGDKTGFLVSQVDVIDTATTGFDATATWAWAETA